MALKKSDLSFIFNKGETFIQVKQGNELQKVGTVHHISAQENLLVIIESSD